VPDSTEVSSRVLTIPNVVSFIGLAFIPLFLWLIWEGENLLGLVVLLVAVSTDFVDGLLARRLGQISKLGQVLDQLGDRLFIAAAVVALGIPEVVPLWVVVILLGRDVLLGIGSVIFSRWGVGVLPVKWMGNWATFALLLALPMFFLAVVFPQMEFILSPYA
jgi:Phosphatidylglycerophosphate synthase